MVTVQLYSLHLVDGNLRRCHFRNCDRNSRLRPRVRHQAKVLVWGGISTRGNNGPSAVFSESVRMDSSIYCQILERAYLKFMNKRHHGGYIFLKRMLLTSSALYCTDSGFARLVHDSAPAHRSSFTKSGYKKDESEPWTGLRNLRNSIRLS